jgi:hypothetical protein
VGTMFGIGIDNSYIRAWEAAMTAFTHLAIVLEASCILDVSCIDGWDPETRIRNLYYTRR